MTKICIFASSEDEARRWAKSQNLSKDQYFYPRSKFDLYKYDNFHVIVVGIGNIGEIGFEEAYNLALERGKIGRF